MTDPAVSASRDSSRSEFSASGQRALGPHADQDDPLQAERAVLDLGDVLELGGQPADPAQRMPVQQVQFACLGGARPGRIATGAVRLVGGAGGLLGGMGHGLLTVGLTDFGVLVCQCCHASGLASPQ